ncbi:MAG: hypothetical protein NC253_15645 [Ruminococcus sp.]|nr:hypothetical protein [Ruminococcus sp.]MCM1380586.1 hypothetical protein [Muribaculaceae bacterium]MCM1479769.1 hypothetical protein [Muribaculaceae bacterium]
MPNNPNFAANLKPVTSSGEAKERGRNGGIKLGQTRRARKQARECMELILSSKVTKDEHKQILSNMGIKDKDKQNIMLLMASLFYKGVSTGDSNTIKTILEISGDLNQLQEKQDTQINITVSAATAEDIENT